MAQRSRPGRARWLASCALLLGACSGLSAVDPSAGGDVVPPVLPVLRVDTPARGSFHEGPVAVHGSVEQGTGILTELEVHGAPVSWGADGSFQTSIAAEPGMLLLGARLQDDIGERAVDGRAVQVGPTHPPGAMLPEAIGIQIGAALLDNNTAELDDLAGVVEAILADPAFGDALIGAEIPGDPPIHYIEIHAFSIDAAVVEITPWADLMWLDLYLYGVEVEFTAYTTYGTFPGWITVDGAALETDLTVDAVARGLSVEVSEVWVDLDGFAWGIPGLPAAVTDVVRDMLRERLEETLEEQTQERVGGLIGDTLGAFAIDMSLGELGRLGLKMEIARSSLSTQGLVLWMDASMRAVVPEFIPPAGAGSLATPGAPPVLPRTTTAPLVIVADDDFVNQATFAFWLGGSLGGWELDGVSLTAMTGNNLPPPLGPVKRARMRLDLPPILSPPAGDMNLDISIGELVLRIEREDDEVIEASINARAGANVTLGSEGLSVEIDDRPAQMTLHAGVTRWPTALDPGDLSSLFRLSTPPLLGRSSSLFPALPAPAIPIGAFIEVPAVADLTWAFGDASVRVEPSGWLVLEGRMVPGP